MWQLVTEHITHSDSQLGTIILALDLEASTVDKNNYLHWLFERNGKRGGVRVKFEINHLGNIDNKVQSRDRRYTHQVCTNSSATGRYLQMP